jgi:hypothetical protein
MTASTMSMSEIYNALTKRLVTLGRDPTDAPGRAASMLINWDRFTDADSDALGTGGRTVDMWMDRDASSRCRPPRLLHRQGTISERPQLRRYAAARFALAGAPWMT